MTGTSQDGAGGAQDASRPPGYVAVPPRRPAPPGQDTRRPDARPDTQDGQDAAGRDGQDALPRIRVGQVPRRTVLAVLALLGLLVGGTLALAAAPPGWAAVLMGLVLVAVLGWAAQSLWRGSGLSGRRPGRSLSRGLGGRSRWPGTGRLSGRLGSWHGRGRGRDGRFVGGPGRAGGTGGVFGRTKRAAAGRAAAARDASRRTLSRAQGVLPSWLGGTRPRRTGRPDASGTGRGALGRLRGLSGRPRASSASSASSAGKPRTPGRTSGRQAGGTGRPGAPAGAGRTSGGRRAGRPAGGAGDARPSGGRGGPRAGRGLPFIGRTGGHGPRPGGRGTVISTDGDLGGGPSRGEGVVAPAGRDNGDGDDPTDDPDDRGDPTDAPPDGREGLSRWERWGYGTEDHVRAGWQALVDPLRRRPPEPFAVGVDDDLLDVDPLPQAAVDYLADPHTPADQIDWPEPRAADYEWPADPAPPPPDTSPHVSSHPPDLPNPYIDTRSTTMTINVREFDDYFQFNENTTVAEIRGSFRDASAEAFAQAAEMKRQAADLAAEANRCPRLSSARDSLMRQASKRQKDADGYTTLAVGWKNQSLTYGSAQKSA
ncbi:hypothetical protein [Actinosynnema sp. NPDC023587]|uniref:hypothetical protein n=1 Tax=Actinosynnema sp. NPDC023587 TaxID=3154695 RepID=UPI0033C8B909